jgi:hypothetical protein
LRRRKENGKELGSGVEIAHPKDLGCNRRVVGRVREESMSFASLAMVDETWVIYTGEGLGTLFMAWI